jgi:DNA-directed RNA polymerase subunit RPC12/RpoP
MAADNSKPVKIEYDQFGFVRDYVCPHCGGPVKENNTDDVGTIFYRCQKCGQISHRLKNIEKERFLQPFREAVELLKNPKLLWLIKEDMDRTIKGEDENKLLLWLLELSARTRDYTFVDVLGESAVGKTNLVRETLRIVPKEWWRKVGRMTRTAIDYLKDQNFYLLWIQEARGAGEAEPSLRLQSADDGGLTIWTTERDKETGRFATNEHHVPGRGVITTTTSVSFSPEDATRTWMVSAEPGEAQTKRIIKYKLARAQEPPELLEALGKQQKDLAPIVQQALLMLDWDSPVIIPYADDLSGLFSPKLVRVRRDVDKFLGLIKIIARVHQFQRPIVEVNGKRFIVAVAQDALLAFQLGANPLEETLTGLERRLREVYDAIKELGEATSTQVGVKIHKGSEYARRALRVLVEMGYVDVDESQKTHMYLIRKTENPSNDLHGLQRTFSCSELQKKVDSFLSSIPSQPPADRAESETNWKKDYFDPISGVWVDLEAASPPPPEVERRLASTSQDTLTFDELNLRDGPHQLTGEMYHNGVCYKCKKTGQISWYYSDFKGEKHELCTPCGWAVSKELEKRAGGS